MANFGTPQYWRDKARQSREIAATISLKDARVLLLTIAEQYDELAARAEQAGDADSHCGRASVR